MDLTKTQRDKLVQKIEELELNMYDPDREQLSIEQERAMNTEVDHLRNQFHV